MNMNLGDQLAVNDLAKPTLVRAMPPKRKAAGAARAAPAARRPAKKAAPPPAAAETAAQPPAAKRQRSQARREGRGRSDAAQPTSWLELAECEQFQAEVAEITDRAALSIFLQRLRETDPQKHNLIQANHEAFVTMLPEEMNDEEDNDDEDDGEIGSDDGSGGGSEEDSDDDDQRAAPARQPDSPAGSRQTALPAHAKLKWSPQRDAWTWVGCRGGFIRLAVHAEIPSSRKTAAAKAAHTRTTGGAAAKPAASAVQPSPSKMSAKQVSDELLRRMRGNSGDGVQHRLGEVISRSHCNIEACRKANAIFGCKACKIHLCSPECYSAHLYDNAKLSGKCCATFKEISRFKQTNSNPKKGRQKPPAAPPAAAPPAAARRKQR